MLLLRKVIIPYKINIADLEIGIESNFKRTLGPTGNYRILIN